MPEMIRFLAFEPFGIKTGGLLYSAMDAMASVALRREYDPYFDAQIEGMGHGAASRLLSYMLPGEPWGLVASAPPWATDLARQGLSGAAAAERGQQDPGVSLVSPVTRSLARLTPWVVTLPMMGRAVDEIVGQPTPREVARREADENKALKAAELRPTLQRVLQELQEALR